MQPAPCSTAPQASHPHSIACAPPLPPQQWGRRHWPEARKFAAPVKQNMYMMFCDVCLTEHQKVNPTTTGIGLMTARPSLHHPLPPEPSEWHVKACSSLSRTPCFASVAGAVPQASPKRASLRRTLAAVGPLPSRCAWPLSSSIRAVVRGPSVGAATSGVTSCGVNDPEPSSTKHGT